MDCGRWSPAAAKALALAIELAMRTGEEEVNVHHLAAALRSAGGEDLESLFRGYGVMEVPKPAEPAALARRLPWQRRRPVPSRALTLQAVLRAAESLSADGPPTTRHMLAALLASGDPAAEPFLEAGIRPADVLGQG